MSSDTPEVPSLEQYLAEYLDFRKTPKTANMVFQRWPVFALANQTITSSMIHDLVFSDTWATAPEGRLCLILSHVCLNNEEWAYLLQTETRPVVQHAILATQYQSPEKILEAVRMFGSALAASYVVRNAEKLGITPMPLDVLEKAPPENRLRYLADAPEGTYAEQAPQWFADFREKALGKRWHREALAYVLQRRPDLRDVLPSDATQSSPEDVELFEMYFRGITVPSYVPEGPFPRTSTLSYDLLASLQSGKPASEIPMSEVHRYHVECAAYAQRELGDDPEKFLTLIDLATGWEGTFGELVNTVKAK